MNPGSGMGMNGPILLLITCYALLGLLLLALCLYTRWSWWIKSVAILLTGGFFILSYDAMTGLLGFPTPGRLPERFLFHYAVVVQPEKNSGSKGTIYIWASELAREGPVKQPRAYEMPFDKDSYNMFTEATRRNKQGIMQMGQTLEALPASGVNTFTRYMSSSRTQKVKMQDLPEPALPEK